MTTRTKATPAIPLLDVSGLPLPHDTQAEQWLIGALSRFQESFDQVSMIVSQNDFFDPNCRAVYGVIAQLCGEGKEYDGQLLLKAVKKANAVEDDPDSGLTAQTFLVECATKVATSAHAKHYAELISRLAIKRNLALNGHRISSLGYDENREADEALNEADNLLMQIRDGRQSHNQIIHVGDLLAEELIVIEKRKNGLVKPGLSTGYAAADRLFRLRKQELIILAGRPSQGKTALAMNIAANICRDSQVLFVSIEMSAEMLAERFLSLESGVFASRLADGTHSREDRSKVVEAHAKSTDCNFYIAAPTTAPRINDIAAMARQHKRKHKSLGLLIIDYLQLIEPDSRKEPRHEQVSLISRRLKGLARQLDVPVLCLAQLNRQVENLSNPRPRMSHLRESGAIEQDADIVMFIHRDESYATTDDAKEAMRGQATMIIEKHRNGATGDVPLVWMPETQKFGTAADPSHSRSYAPPRQYRDSEPEPVHDFGDYSQDNF